MEMIMDVVVVNKVLEEVNKKLVKQHNVFFFIGKVRGCRWVWLWWWPRWSA